MADDTPKRKNRPGQGRPFKMKIWVEKLKEVLDENTALFLTDEDLVFLVNEKIEDSVCHITTRTLRNWKAGKTDPKAEDVAHDFARLIQNALIKQKQAVLTKMLETEDRSWPKYAWILERRFAEWNLKQISEVQHTSNQPIIQIQASNEQQMQLIDNIINGDVVDVDFKEVEPIKLEAKNDNEKEDDYDF